MSHVIFKHLLQNKNRVKLILSNVRIMSYKASLNDTTLFGGSSGPMKLTTGAPSIEALKDVNKIVSKCSELLLSGNDDSNLAGDSLQYGPRLGSPYFSREVAKFLTESYADEVKSDNILQTSGASSGLYTTASLFFRQNDVVFVDDPTYFIAFNILRDDLGLKIVSVESDNEGMKLSDLQQKIQQHVSKTDVTAKRPFRAMAYLIPTFHNPTSRVISEKRSKELIELAKNEKLLLFTDDVYNLLHYEPTMKTPPRRLFAYDHLDEGNVISNGSFAKILAPGLRLGWMEMAPKLMQLFYDSGILWSSGATNHYISVVVAKSIETGLLQAHILNLRETYRKNINDMSNIILKETPFIKFEKPAGGYFLWLELPSNLDGEYVAKHCLQKYNTMILPGFKCSAVGNFKNFVRLSFNHLTGETLLNATRNFCKAANDVFQEKSSL